MGSEMCIRDRNKAKELLCYSGVALLLNAIFNIVFFKLWGILGPAIATVVVTLFLSCIITMRNAQMLCTKVFVLLRVKQLMCIFVECILMGIVSYIIKTFLSDKVNTFWLFMISYGVYITPLIAINYKKIMLLLREINKTKLS